MKPVSFSFIAISLLFLLPIIAAIDFIDDLQRNYPVRSVLFDSPRETVQGDFESIKGVAISPITGEVYFAEYSMHQIFKFVENDEVQLVAGTGEKGYADGDSLKAKFNFPQDLAFHPNGSLLAVADSYNLIIRIIRISDGKVSTLAGNPGVAGSSDGVGLSATFGVPSGLTFDSMGNVLVADSGNSLIRKIELSSGRVTTIAGNGKKGWNSDQGPARSISLFSPKDICFDPSDRSFYFTDTVNNAIRRVNSSGYMTTVIRNEALLSYPVGIVKLNNSLLISDGYLFYIVRIDLKSLESRVWAGSSDGVTGFFDGSLEAALFKYPSFLALDPFNSSFLLVSDAKSIRSISFRNKFVSTVLGSSSGMGLNDGVGPQVRFHWPSSLSVDEKNQIIYVSDTSNRAIRRILIQLNHKVETVVGFSSSGYLDGSFTVARLAYPEGILVDPDDPSKVLICDYGNAVRILDMKTKSVSTFIPGIQYPVSIAKNENGNFFVLDDFNLYVINVTGNVDLILKNNDCSKAASASFLSATGITSYFNGTMYLSSFGCHVIMKMVYSSNGTSFELIAGDGMPGFKDGFGTNAQFNMPYSLVSSQGFLFIADWRNSAIRQLNLSDNNRVVTISGTGESGYRNGLANHAKYSYPSGIEFFNGSLYIADQSIHAIRMLKDEIVTTIAGPGAPIYLKESTVVQSIISPKAIACLDRQICFVVDSLGNAVLKMSFDGNGQVMEFSAFSGNGSPGWLDGIGINAMFNNPTVIVIDTNMNRLLIADSDNHLIRSIDISSGTVSTIAGIGYAGKVIKTNPLECFMNMPRGIAIVPISNAIFISDSGNHRILVFYSKNNTIAVYAGSGIPGFVNGKSKLASSFYFPTSLAFDAVSETLFILDSYNHAIRSIGKDGVVKTVCGEESGYVDGAGSKARFYRPISLAVHRTVENLNLFVADSGNHAVRVISINESGNWTVQTWLKDEKSYYKAVAVGDSKILVLDGKSVVSYGRLKFTSARTFANDPQSSELQMIIVSISIGSIALLSAIIVFAYVRVKRTMPGSQQTTRILTRIGEKKTNHKVSDRSQSVTVSPSKTVAIAIPGYLQVEIDRTIAFSSEIQVSGKGGTAQVIKCKLKDPKLIEKHGIVDVVVKIFGQGTSRESFLYEVMLMSALPKSPNLIQLLGYSQDRVLSIIMKEYPMSLRDLLVEKSFLNNSETNLKVAVDIAKGMNLIHQKGIVHFDLKPANVLAEVVNGSWSYVVCDFGFANFLSDVQDKIVKGVKKPTAIGITARYAAPELFAKLNVRNLASSLKDKAPMEIEKKIDVYAYSMTLFYVYVREAPWKDLSVEEIERFAIAGERPEIPSSKFDNAKKIEDLMKVSWSQDPSERPGFDEILEILLNRIE